MNRRQLVEKLWDEVENHLAAHGYELVEIEYTRQGQTPLLRIFIDKPGGGITHEDCVAVTQLLSPLLDSWDYIDSSYMLEVSSPGIDRPLRKPADFERFAGEPVRLATEAPTEGRKRFAGILRGFQDGLITVSCDDREYAIHIENLKNAKLDR